MTDEEKLLALVSKVESISDVDSLATLFGLACTMS